VLFPVGDKLLDEGFLAPINCFGDFISVKFDVLMGNSCCHNFDITKLGLMASVDFVNKAFYFLMLIVVEVTVF
jgi:hypothetical protein